MSRNAGDLHNRHARFRASRVLTSLSPWQRSIERHAIRLRVELGITDLDSLDQANAFALIPNCEVWAIKNVPGITLQTLSHFRIAGRGCAAWAVPDDSGNVTVFFNDSHHPKDVRVHLMEEFFHLRLGHMPDTVRVYREDGDHRTYNKAKEDEAYGCGAASLVPYVGLQFMIAQGEHISRIAEHYVVPVPVVEFRIEVTKLGDLVKLPMRQLPMLANVMTTR